MKKKTALSHPDKPGLDRRGFLATAGAAIHMAP